MIFCQYREGREHLLSAFLLLITLILSIPAISVAQTLISISPANKIALGIETEAVLSPDSYAQITATGVVVAPQGSSFPITSPLNGVMIKPLVFPGMSVEKGQEVALLHSPEYSTIRAELETSRLTMVHDEHLFESAEKLYEIGMRSELELDEARHELDSARLVYSAITDRLSLLVAGGEAGQFILTSPVDGIVSNISAEQGSEVIASRPLVTIFAGNKYWARVQLPENGVTQVELQTKVQLAQTDTPGSVVAINPEIDPSSRSMEVVVELPEDVHWRIGQLVSASFVSNVEPGTLALPEQSIVRIGGNTFVFVEEPSGFRLTPVIVASRSRNVVIVSGNLAEGDRIAISGIAALKNIVEGA